MSESQKTEFDADFSPDHPINEQAAEDHGFTYDPKRKVYVDSDGCPVRDHFGQVLG